MSKLRIDSYVIDTLMRDLVEHDKQPSAFLVYLYIWRQVADGQAREVPLSHQRIADGTGLSRSAVQAAIQTLTRRQLVKTKKAFPTATPRYSLEKHWERKK